MKKRLQNKQAYQADGYRPEQPSFPPLNEEAPLAAPQISYPPQDGYDAGQGAYPPQDGYDAGQGAYPPQDGYDAQQGAYPPQDGYDAQQGAYPPQDGYDAQQGAYPPQDGYDAGQGAYPPQDGYDAGQGAYPPQDGGYDAQQDPYADNMDLPPDEYAKEYEEQYGDYAPEAEENKPKKRTIFKPRTRKPSFVLAVLVNVFRMLVLLVLLCSLAGVGAVVGIAKAYMETAPDLDLALIDDQAQTSFIYDADGNLITDYKGTENRVMVSIDTMPQILRNAFVAVEDARFYTHNGVDLKRIAGAFISNFISGTQQGGSTITQQLIKNTVLSDEQSYKRKIQEAYLAMQLETKYTKEQILESYLNTIYLGENYYGVKVAAYGFFGKDNLQTLTLRECAMLAGVTTNPYYYNPRRNFYLRESETTDYAAITNNRTDYVLRCMYENQFISKQQYEEALNPATASVLKTSPESKEIYPYTHYVEYAVRDVIQTLLRLNNLENTSVNRNKMENELRTGGYQVFLALDTQIQQTVEDTLYNYDNYPALNNSADKIYRARNSDGTYEEIVQPQAAAVVLDYRTGEIKAIVGSRTKPTQKKTLNRAADMNMPVGSSIKPISVYAPAIDMGAGAGTILYNMPLPVSGWRGDDGKDTWPKNYGGSSYRGPETLRTALKKSDNTAAAYALMNYVGVDRSSDYLLRLGVSENHINKTPFGLALGSSGISCIEMAVAFGTLGNGGVYQSPLTFLGLADSNHNVLYDAHANQTRRQVFKTSTAWLTVDILKDVVSSGTGTAAKISGQTVAGKTGTNSDQKGVFFAGMTGWYCATVWIGHDNYKALSSKTTGGNSAAKLWQKFMSAIHTKKALSNRDIIEGSASDYGLVKVTTCAVSGQLATDACKTDQMGYGTVTDYWPKDSAPTASCQMHVNVTVCNDSGLFATQYCYNTSTRGVVIIPRGHPLYGFIGTKYQSVLTDYLGEFAALKMTGNTQADNAMIQSNTCTLHSYGQSYDNGLVNAQLLRDARTLIESASSKLGRLDPYSEAYNTLVSAINNLTLLVNGTPSTDELSYAMTQLTQAMAGI